MLLLTLMTQKLLLLTQMLLLVMLLLLMLLGNWTQMLLLLMLLPFMLLLLVTQVLLLPLLLLPTGIQNCSVRAWSTGARHVDKHADQEGHPQHHCFYIETLAGLVFLVSGFSLE